MSWSNLNPEDIDLKLISCEIEWTCSRCDTNQRTLITHLEQRVTCTFAGCGKGQIYFEFPQSAFGLSGVNGLGDAPVVLGEQPSPDPMCPCEACGTDVGDAKNLHLALAYDNVTYQVCEYCAHQHHRWQEVN